MAQTALEKRIAERQKRVTAKYIDLMKELDALAKLCDKDDRPGMAAKYRADSEKVRQVYVMHF